MRIANDHLPDLHTFAPLQAEKASNVLICFYIFAKRNRQLRPCFVKFADFSPRIRFQMKFQLLNFHEISTGFSRIFFERHRNFQGSAQN